MDNEQVKKPFILELMRNFTTVFSLSVLAISFAGLLVIRSIPDEQHITILFTSGNVFIFILQLAVFSLVLAFFCILLVTERFFYKMRFWLRLLFLFLSTLLTFSGFAIIFKWFPMNNLQTLLGFIICTIICYVFSVCLTLFKYRLEGKKYDKLLANYKTRRNISI